MCVSLFETTLHMKNYDHFAKYTIPIVSPRYTANLTILYKSSSFIIATGDLTDGWKGTGLTKLQQNPQEWHSYYSIVTSAGFNSTFYWDTVGNHDLMTIDGRNDKNLYAKNYTVTGQDVTLDIFVRVFRTDYGSYRVVVFNPEWFFIYVGYG